MAKSDSQRRSVAISVPSRSTHNGRPAQSSRHRLSSLPTSSRSRNHWDLPGTYLRHGDFGLTRAGIPSSSSSEHRDKTHAVLLGSIPLAEDRILREAKARVIQGCSAEKRGRGRIREVACEHHRGILRALAEKAPKQLTLSDIPRRTSSSPMRDHVSRRGTSGIAVLGRPAPSWSAWPQRKMRERLRLMRPRVLKIKICEQ